MIVVCISGTRVQNLVSAVGLLYLVRVLEKKKKKNCFWVKISGSY
eukprot:SAG11_NODE_8170_length_1045_cov_4.421826_2_plen_44_part_01